MKQETLGVEAPSVSEDRVRLFLPQGIETYLHLKGLGCDVSGTDKSLRIAEERGAETDAINVRQLALRQEESGLAAALEDAQAQAAGMRKALDTLQAIHPSPEGLAEISQEADRIERTCEKVLVESERKHSTVGVAFRAGA